MRMQTRQCGENPTSQPLFWQHDQSKNVPCTSGLVTVGLSVRFTSRLVGPSPRNRSSRRRDPGPVVKGTTSSTHTRSAVHHKRVDFLLLPEQFLHVAASEAHHAQVDYDVSFCTRANGATTGLRTCTSSVDPCRALRSPTHPRFTTPGG